MSERIKTYQEFYEFYLDEHKKLGTRIFHFLGILFVFLVIGFVIYTGKERFLWYIPIFGYGFAWLSHAFIERNKPATFKYPLWSLFSDFKLFFELLIGKQKLKLRKKRSFNLTQMYIMKDTFTLISFTMVIAFLMIQCKPMANSSYDNEKTLFIASETKDCTGVAPMKCLQVKEKESESWSHFYSNIEGFTYEPGFEYVLKVKTEKIENPPMDSSSVRYILVEEVSKTKK